LQPLQARQLSRTVVRPTAGPSYRAGATQARRNIQLIAVGYTDQAAHVVVAIAYAAERRVSGPESPGSGIAAVVCAVDVLVCAMFPQ